MILAQKQVGTTQPNNGNREPAGRPIYQQYLPPEFNEMTTQKIAIADATAPITLNLKGTELPVGHQSEATRKSLSGGK